MPRCRAHGQVRRLFDLVCPPHRRLPPDTPVAYPLSQVSAKYRWLFVLNPLSAIVEGFRSALVFDRAPDWTLTAVSASITLVLFAVSFVMFKRLDRYFADVI